MITTSIKEMVKRGFLILDDEDDTYKAYVFPKGLVVLDENDEHLYCIQEYTENGETTVILIRAATTEDPLNSKDGKLNVRIFQELEAENMV